MSSRFFEDIADLPGAGGAWLRGVGPLPDGAVWLPHPGASARRRPLRVVAVLTLVVSLAAMPFLPPPWNAAAFLFAVCSTFGIRGWRAPSSSSVEGHGRHGLVLFEDQLLYRVGPQCAVIHRADVTGVERRVSHVDGVVGAFTLAGHTGRGALPSPAPGPTALHQMQIWWTTSRVTPVVASTGLVGSS